MPFSQKRNRRSVRIQGYDYSQPGEYFVTICTYQMRCLFGEIKNGRMQLSHFGRIVEEEWLKTPLAHDRGVRAHVCAPLRCSPRSLGSIVKGFKSACKKRINRLRQTPRKPVWQRNYHEHIIRDDEDLNDVREYVLANPLRWELEHPQG